MENDKLKTGTTTIGIVYDGGVIMASERRATMGNLIAHKDVRKVYKIDDNVAMTTAGMVGDAQILVRYIRAEVGLYRLKTGAPMTIRGVATLISNILRSGGGSQGFFYVGLIIGGMDKRGGHVYSLDAGGGCIEDRYTTTGSGSLFAYGVLEDGYRDGMTETEAVDLAIKSLNAAMRRDSASGDGMAIIRITDEGYHEFPTEALEKRAGELGINYPK